MDGGGRVVVVESHFLSGSAEVAEGVLDVDMDVDVDVDADAGVEETNSGVVICVCVCVWKKGTAQWVNWKESTKQHV